MSRRPKAKKDYRKGTRPSVRKTDAQNAVRRALSKGEATFGNLLQKTGLSRPALASNLKELHVVGQVERKTDNQDYRITHYSLTAKGIQAYKKQTDLESIEDSEVLSLGDVVGIIKKSMMQWMNVVTYIYDSPQLRISDEDPRKNPNAPTYVIERKDKELFPELGEEEREILGRCLTFSFYAQTPEDKKIDLLPALKELLKQVKSVASSESIDVPRIKKLPNLTFIFQFKSDKLIEQYEYRKKDKKE